MAFGRWPGVLLALGVACCIAACGNVTHDGAGAGHDGGGGTQPGADAPAGTAGAAAGGSGGWSGSGPDAGGSDASSDASEDAAQDASADAGAAGTAGSNGDGGGECAQGALQSLSCGLKGKGKQQQACIGGKWIDQGDCADPDSYASISAGGEHVCAVSRADTLVCWGSNKYGQIIVGSSEPAVLTAPTTVASGVVAVSAGFEHTCAIKTDGSLSCWGKGWDGQLGGGGDGGLTVLGDVSAVSAGVKHTCALRKTGSVACWGEGSDGQLGNWTTADSSKPVPVSGMADAVAVAVGDAHSCALRASGAVWCWGKNDHGQLGDGTKLLNSTPLPVKGLTDATAITAAGNTTCALRKNGLVACWGQGLAGVPASTTPKDVAGVSGVAALGSPHRNSPGIPNGFMCVLTTAGSVQCWGEDHEGQLGSGLPGVTWETSPPKAVANLSGVVALSSTPASTCAIVQSGEIVCWGSNADGRLGNGTFYQSATPVSTGLSDVTQLSLGDHHACAVRATGEVACWGLDFSGALGNGELLKSASVPGPVVGLSDVVSIASTEERTCAVLSTGGIRCWGSNAYSTLGVVLSGLSYVDAPVVATSIGDAAAVAVAREHTCALRKNGTVACWGLGVWGQLGSGTTPDSPTHEPLSVVGIADGVGVAAGDSHTCVLRQGGKVACWGVNFSGELGNGTTENAAAPVDVLGLNDAVTIDAGGNQTCAVRPGGELVCWGASQSTPAILGGVTDAVRVSVSAWGICAIRATGIAECYKGGAKSPILATNVKTVDSGVYFACVLTQTGNVSCWGEGFQGQLGDGGAFSTKALPIAAPVGL